MLKPLFDYLADELELTPKTNWHFGRFPAEAPDNGSALCDNVGARVDPDNNAMRWHRIQVLTRSQSYVAGEAEGNRIAEFLLKIRGEGITGHYIYDVTGSLPAYIGEDAKGRHVFSANFSVSARKE